MGTQKVMIKNIVSTVTALASMSLLLSGCDQPSAGCIVQDSSSWYAKYDRKPGQNIPAACDPLIPKGEPVGVFKYVDPDVADSAVLSLRPNALASRATRDPTVNVPAQGVYPQTAIANLDSEATSDDLCGTSNWSDASVDAAATQTAAATQISYKYSNVRVVARADAPGTQMGGDITYTRTQDGLTCTVELEMKAMWPAIPCDPEDANSCSPEHNISPVYAAVCDPDLEFCVPAKAFPSYAE